MEMTYQNFWDVFSEIPALELPRPFTVLDEFRIVNDADRNWSKARLLEKNGQIADFSTMGPTKSQKIGIIRLFLARKEDLDDISVKIWFSEDFLKSNFYTFWRTMFAFQNWHSVLELKLYMHRFLHLLDGLNDITAVVFPKYNQYDSFVRPLFSWLKEQGVRIQYDTIVLDFDMDINGETQTATAIRCHTGSGEQTIEVGSRDLVFLTLGSIVEDTTYGDNKSTPKPKLNEDKKIGSAWKLWKNMALKSPAFGRPEKFWSNVPKSTWESATLTCKPSPLMEKLKELSVNDPYSGNTVSGGIITIIDSAWLMSFTVNRQPHFIDQPSDVIVPWVFGC